LRQQSSRVAAGRIGVEPMDGEVDFTYAVTARRRLSTPEEFGQIIVHTTESGSIVRLKDIARIELGANNYNFESYTDGRPAVFMLTFLQPGANAIETGDAIRARLEELSADFPKGLQYELPYDTIRFVKISIKEVVKTLIEAMILVFFVVLLFLQNWRATL